MILERHRGPYKQTEPWEGDTVFVIELLIKSVLGPWVLEIIGNCGAPHPVPG
jgi:hypothetical protein